MPAPQRTAFPPTQFITQTDDLAALCQRLAGEAFVTVDTEFMRERTYWPELCVVQLAGTHDVAVVDAQAAGLDLAPLGVLLADPGVVKVFHAARQDVEIFLQLFGAVPAPLFDTQVAAMVAGFGDQVGYDSLVGALTGGQIDKAHRFSDWSARPLSPAQVNYAAADVTYLRQVYERLSVRLEKEGRTAWVAEELAILANPVTYRPDPETMWERMRPRTANRRVLGAVRRNASTFPASAWCVTKACWNWPRPCRRLRRRWAGSAVFRAALRKVARGRGCWRRSRRWLPCPKTRCLMAVLRAKVPNLRPLWWRCLRFCWRKRPRRMTWRPNCWQVRMIWTGWQPRNTRISRRCMAGGTWCSARMRWR
jgi:hypothetical protein